MNEITEDIETENMDHRNQSQPKSARNVNALLEGRQEMYVKAVAAAKSSGDATKSRRLERQLKVYIYISIIR